MFVGLRKPWIAPVEILALHELRAVPAKAARRSALRFGSVTSLCDEARELAAGHRIFAEQKGSRERDLLAAIHPHRVPLHRAANLAGSCRVQGESIRVFVRHQDRSLSRIRSALEREHRNRSRTAQQRMRIER
jgi:hypothetical protein